MTDERSFQSLAFSAETNEAEQIETFALPYLVVGLGASAGGVEAYIALLGSLPPDTGMAFVMVPHLAPDHKSHMVEILQKHTSMPVSHIEHGAVPLPDHVYIVPPNYYVSLSRGMLRLEMKTEKVRILAIDYFFRSLAADQRNKSIGVVLSGMDSDGAAGLTAIKGEGGIAIVQEPDSARHPDMPRSSIAADHVDKVMRPAGIAEELARLARLFKSPQLEPLENGEISPDDKETLQRIFKLLRGVSGLDFSLYKPGTVHRRVARRLLVNKTESLSEYLKQLQSDAEELHTLQEDLLVGLTRFFRDPDMFHFLQTSIFPNLFETRPPNQPLRFWVAGCSTGEEVYSLVICLLEYITTNRLDAGIQVFGTDASERSIEKARSGIYPESLANEISSERLQRYFIRVEGGFQVTKRVRDVCIFARQNLCTDPPFSRLDLITCRNVLIYLGPILQRQVIPTFHYALKNTGFLVLGMSESIREFPNLFEPVDRKNKAYSKIGSARVSLDLPRLLPSNRTFTPPSLSNDEQPVRWSELDLQRIADRIVIAQYGPPGFVIDNKLEILQSRGNVTPFISLAEGSASFNLLRMLNPNIAVQVRDAVQRSIDQDVPIKVEDLCMVSDGDVQQFNVEILPVHTPPATTSRFLVLFTPKSAFLSRPFREVVHTATVLPTGTEESLTSQLQQDLTSSKLYLQSLIEERDLRNQELTSSNEEVQAANEELQSTNEELETTKEELQSANEELQTVNEELSHRNVTLTETSNDLANLLTSVNIPVLMLNNELQIRQFTPLTQKLLSVRPTDIGRPISEIRLNFFVEGLEEVMREVLETLTTRELEVQDREGRWHILKIRPYRTSDNKIEGVVLIMLDIDQLRRSQINLREARDFARDVIEAVQVPVVILEQTLIIRSANNAFRMLSGLTPGELEGRSFPDLAARIWGLATVSGELERLGAPNSQSAHFESEFESEKPQRRTFYIRARALTSEGGQVLLLTLEDFTERKQAEQIMASENRLLAGQVQSTSQALGQTREELRALTARLFTSQEEERQRVARDLHDDVGQQLALVQMDIEQVQTRLTEQPDSLVPQLDSLSRRVASLSDDVRRLSHRLHPSILNDLGIGFALKSLLDEFGERESMPASFTRINVPEQLPKPVAATLYRIAQEALRNVVKHAGRTHVRVILEGADEKIRLQIVDMGDGFDQDQRVQGLGLLSMAERARLAGGTFQISSQLGRGTEITVEIPLSS